MLKPSGEAGATTPSLFIHPASIVDPLDWAHVFSTPQPVEVELGCGDGSFMLQYAARHPERNFLAIERLLGRIRKLDRKGPRMGLKNLRLLRLEASYTMEYMLPPQSVQAIHVYFPDPWPKRRHHRRRLINEHFMVVAQRVLTPGGVLYLRTDEPSYFAQMVEVGRAANAAFKETPTPDDLSAITTDFEKDFLAKGIATHRIAFQRIQ